jgi:hypothetical protein
MENEARLAEIQAIESLGVAIRWALAQTPRAEFVDVVVQDEYTHDVIVRVDDALYVVFGTT